jgi:hypothetical protein
VLLKWLIVRVSRADTLSLPVCHKLINPIQQEDF